MIPCYEITVDGEYPTVVTAASLMEAWADNAPEGVAKAFYLRLEDIATICETPRVRARRIR